MRKKERYEKLLENNMTNTIEMKETEEGHYQFNIPLPEAVTLKRPLEHHYCFRKDRHSTNFYLKIGAAGTHGIFNIPSLQLLNLITLISVVQLI